LDIRRVGIAAVTQVTKDVVVEIDVILGGPGLGIARPFGSTGEQVLAAILFWSRPARWWLALARRCAWESLGRTLGSTALEIAGAAHALSPSK